MLGFFGSVKERTTSKFAATAIDVRDTPLGRENSIAVGSITARSYSTIEDKRDDVVDDNESENENDNNGDNNRTSNVYVLNVAFFSFLGFMGFQAVFAIIANSEAMLADCEAMSVDALTYLFNLVAERVKNRPYSERELQTPKPQRLRNREMMRLYLELIPPLISVTTLIVVTIFVIQDSVDTLFGLESGEDNKEEVDVQIMLLFSALNLVLDLVNVLCFARADQAFGVNQFVHNFDSGYHHHTTPSISGELILAEKTPLVSVVESGIEVQKEADDHNDNNKSDAAAIPFGINLNMCSAWTHVCADTMRSVAVLIAAAIATVFKQIESQDADAWAAIIVSVIILGSLLPLLHGLFLTTKEIIVLSRTPLE